MTRHFLPALLVASATCFGAPWSSRGAEPTQSKPNIVVILADDLGYADVGVHGCQDIPTPHIDRLAATGVRFSNGYSSHAFCSPMRASLMTGRYQQRFGYLTNVPYDPQNPHLGLPTEEPTIANRLQKAGYRTGAIGKWHLGAAHPFHPNKRGFDFFYGFLGGGHDYFQVDLHRPMQEGYFQPLLRDSEPENFEGYLTDVLSAEAVHFIERNRDRPFFLYLAYNAPHTPMQAPPSYLERFASIADPKRRTYAAMVNAMDEGIGQVLASLERHGLRRQTLVFFLSDNGGPTAANASRNDPLRGFKGDVWEGGIRVPFLMSWPGVVPEGKVCDAPVISLDISRTALAVAGADPGTHSNLDGADLVPFVTGPTQGPPHEALYWKKEGGNGWAIRMGSQKLVMPRKDGAPALFDLSTDLGERRDLATDQADAARSLQEQYEQWDRLNQPARFLDFRTYHERKNKFYRLLQEPEG